MAIHGNYSSFMDKIASDLDEKQIYGDAEIFSGLHRYSGSADGEKAVDIIMGRMAEYGVPAVRETYELYRSLPLSAKLQIHIGDITREYNATPFVYSEECENLEGKIVFDGKFNPDSPTRQMEEGERCKEFKGNFVFTYDASFQFVMMAKRHGAKGIITAWALDIVHHGTTGRVWGNPEPDDLAFRYADMPFAELKKSDGDELLDFLKKGEVTGNLTVRMDNGVKQSSMVIATVKGKSDKYVLVSGHYDSWYEGITDNGIANVAMMDMARVFKANQHRLERTVVFAWWSGHSDGRYAGSTWYYDNHYEDLKNNCVAHINMDICGCMGSDLVGINSSTLEGKEFCHDFLEEFNDEAPIPAVKMARFADQTFWGVNVPFAIMPKFSVKNAGARVFYWWHSPEDGIDKVDRQIMMRDAKAVAKLGAYFSLVNPLPAHFDEFIDMMDERLKEIQGAVPEGFDLSRVYPKLAALRKATGALSAAIEKVDESDDIIMKTGGELARLTFTYSSPYHQDEAVDYGMFPVLSQSMGVTDKNTDAIHMLALKTSFTRQVNRLVCQLDAVMEAIDFQLMKWNC